MNGIEVKRVNIPRVFMFSIITINYRTCTYLHMDIQLQSICLGFVCTYIIISEMTSYDESRDIIWYRWKQLNSLQFNCFLQNKSGLTQLDLAQMRILIVVYLPTTANSNITVIKFPYVPHYYYLSNFHNSFPETDWVKLKTEFKTCNNSIK